MKTIRTILLAVLVACMLIVTPTPAQATAPVDLTIEADLGMTSQATAAGDFSIIADGLFSDFGPASEVFFIDLDEGTIHGVKTLEGEQGTITIKFQAELAFDFSSASGRFVILSGTGAYEKLHGVGTTEATITGGHIYAEYQGTAHFD